jgi:excisionase family DNA binding protein
MKPRQEREQEGVPQSPELRPHSALDSGSRQDTLSREDGRPRSFERPFTVGQAARILGTSPDTVRRLLREGRIAYERVSERTTVIRESALRAYIDSVKVEARP